MDKEKQTVMGQNVQRSYHMWLTEGAKTFSSSLHTVTEHVTVFNFMDGYQDFKAAHYHHLHLKESTSNHTTHCQNADASVQAYTTVKTKIFNI